MQGPPAAGCASAAFNPKIVSRQTVSIGAQATRSSGGCPLCFCSEKTGFSAGGSTDARRRGASEEARLACASAGLYRESPAAPGTARSRADACGR